MSNKFELFDSTRWLCYKLPNFWNFVELRDLRKLTVEDLKNVDYLIQMNGGQYFNEEYLLNEDKETYHKIVRLYEHKKREYEKEIERQRIENSENYGDQNQYYGYYAAQGYSYPTQGYGNSTPNYGYQNQYPYQNQGQEQDYYYGNQGQQQTQAYYPNQNQNQGYYYQYQGQPNTYYQNQPNYNKGAYGQGNRTGNNRGHYNNYQQPYTQPQQTQGGEQQNYYQKPIQQDISTRDKPLYVEKREEAQEQQEDTSPQVHPQKVELDSEPKPEPPKEEEPAPKEESKPKPEPKKFSVNEIKKMIEEAKKEDIAKYVSPKLVKEVQDMKKWEKKEQTVEITAVDTRFNKKNSKQPNNPDFNKGRNYKPNKESQFAMGSNFGKPGPSVSVPDITIGKNQSLETRLEKKKLKEKAAEVNYAAKKQEEEKSLDQIEKAKRDINYHLNRIAPENLKDVLRDLSPFAKQNLAVCEALINLIIQKSWEQPKYASSYAKLCSYFIKIEERQFNFQAPSQKKDKKTNPFKHILIEKVQHSFDKKQKNIPEFQTKLDEETYLRDTKKNMLGNVKFIGQLIKFKVIKKKTIKYCVQQLMHFFLYEHYQFVKTGEFKFSFYEYQFEALIEFLQNLGQKYESIDDQKEEKDDKEPSKYSEAEKLLKDFCEKGVEPQENEAFGNLKADEYFKLFIIIDKNILSKKKGRISALLKNLEERRDNKWKKHHVEAEGPKKLKDIKNDEDEFEPEQKMRKDLAKLDERLTKTLKLITEGDQSWTNEIDKLAKSYEPEDFMESYFKLVAEDKKDAVLKRLEAFDHIVDKHYQQKGFKKAWEASIKNLSLVSSDIPFCSAALAKILATVNEKKGVRFDEFFLKFDKDEEEDEFYFMENIYEKLYYYTQNEEIRTFVTPKAKLSHLL